jgi:hypothetical protein
MNWYLKLSQTQAQTVTAYHGTKSAQPIATFSVPSSFTTNIEMARGYINKGGSYYQDGKNQIYTVQVTYSRPYQVSTQQKLRDTLLKFNTDRAFKKSILSQGYDAFTYGIPNFDSDAIIAPIKSSSQVKIVKVNEYTDEELQAGAYLPNEQQNKPNEMQ